MSFHYKMLNCVQTKLITYGDPFSNNGEDVIICVTGNPGIVDLYIEFGSALYKYTGIPVCVIGQAGHEEVPDERSNLLKGQEHLFDLEGQVAHKLDLIKIFLDYKCKLHLIGHSIGAWMIIELINNNDNIYEKVSSVNLLFPTIQNMAKTSNGRWINNIVRRVHWLLLFMCTLMTILPELICLMLIKSYLRFSSLSTQYSRTLLKYMNSKILQKVLLLAYDEMDIVTSLNINGLEKIKNFSNVIYGTEDAWVPLTYMQDLSKFKPHLQMREEKIDHAFVLKASNKVAFIVSEFIKTKLMIPNNEHVLS